MDEGKGSFLISLGFIFLSFAVGLLFGFLEGWAFFSGDSVPDGCRDQSSIVYAPDGTHTITYECETP